VAQGPGAAPSCPQENIGKWREFRVAARRAMRLDPVVALRRE